MGKFFVARGSYGFDEKKEVNVCERVIDDKYILDALQNIGNTVFSQYLCVCSTMLTTLALYNNLEEVVFNICRADEEIYYSEKMIFEEAQDMSGCIKQLSDPQKNLFNSDAITFMLGENKVEVNSAQVIEVDITSHLIRIKFSQKGALWSEAVEELLYNFESIMKQLLFHKATIRDLVLKVHAEEDITCSVVETTLKDAIKGSLQDNASRILLENSSHSYTYEETDRISNCLVDFFRDRGIQAEDAVIILSDGMSKELVELPLLLALWKNGNVVVPLSDKYPASRIDYVIQQTNAVFLIKPSNLQYQGNIPSEDMESLLQYRQNHKGKKYDFALSELALIIFTSGTTGLPKGVKIPFSSLDNLFLTLELPRLFGAGIRQMISLTWGFDAFISAMITSVLTGSSLIMQSPNQIEEFKIALSHAEGLVATPSALRSILHTFDDDVLQELKYVYCGGENFGRDLYALIQKKCFRIEKIVNGYGPTEATICTGLEEVETEDAGYFHEVPNVKCECYRNNIRMPYGALGEIVIFGAGLTDGYINDGENAKNFTCIDGKKAYRTGDMGFTVPKNQYFVCGRIGQEDYIKRNGYRININEISECLILNFECEAKTILYDGKLILFYSSNDVLDKEMILEMLYKELPAYEYPDFVWEIDEIPVTNNMKADVASLIEIHSSRLESENRKINLNDKELHQANRLLNIFRSMDKYSNMTVHSGIKEYNINSLDIYYFITEAAKLGMKIDFQTFFLCDSIGKLVKKMNLGESRKINFDTLNIFVCPLCSSGEVYNELIKRLELQKKSDIMFYPAIPENKSEKFSVHMNRFQDMVRQSFANYKRIQLWGHSFGGKLAYYAASRMQNENQGISAVVIFDTTPVSEKSTIVKLRKMPFFKLKVKRALKGIFNKNVDFPRKKEHVQQYVKELTYLAENDIEILDKLKECDVPMLVLQSAENDFDMDIWHDLDKNLDVNCIEGTAHLDILDSEETFLTIAQWEKLD